MLRLILLLAFSLCYDAVNVGKTNEVARTVDSIRLKRLGADILVSEIGLGTQRWMSEDFNAPDMSLCHAMMDRAILESGVNLIGECICIMPQKSLEL